MTTALATIDQTGTALAEWTQDRLDLLKRTICKDLTNDEFALFAEVCKARRLDPFLRQIYAVKRKQGDDKVMTIQTGIDGFRLIADRTGRYAPGKAPEYHYDADGKLYAATSFVRKMTPDGTWHEVSALALWNEYKQEAYGKLTPLWQKMPHTMLAKCAEALALRKAFPADLSGLYTDDEMAQADAPQSAQVVIDAAPIIETQPAALPAPTTIKPIARLKWLWDESGKIFGMAYQVPDEWRGKPASAIDLAEIAQRIDGARAHIVKRIGESITAINKHEDASADMLKEAEEWSSLMPGDVSDADLLDWAAWAAQTIKRLQANEIPF